MWRTKSERPGLNGAALKGTACPVVGVANVSWAGCPEVSAMEAGFPKETFKTASSESERKLRERGSVPLLCGCSLPQPGTEGISGAGAEV